MIPQIRKFGFLCLLLWGFLPLVAGAESFRDSLPQPQGAERVHCAELTSPPPFRNNPLPQRPDTLRILGVGNSFTDDGMMFLPELLREAGVGPVVLGRLFFGGCSLEQHCRFFEENTRRYVYSRSDGDAWQTISREASLSDAFADGRWDIVVVQQASTLSGLYESYTPWLDQLLGIVTRLADNPQLCVAWQMTWSYSSDCTRGGYEKYDHDPVRMYEAIAAATQQMVARQGVDVVIPTGATIQNLRRKGVSSAREFTRDGFHLDLGIGRYAAACTWFEALIAPIYGCTVVGNTFRIPDSSGTPVTDANAAACQRAASAAVGSPYATTPH